MPNVNDFTPIKNKVFVSDMDTGEKLSRGGIIITDDDMKTRGVRDRWAKVWKVGPEVDDIVPGDWVLIKHGRWTHGMDITQADGTQVRVWNIEYPDAVIVLADEDPRALTTTTHTK